MAQQTFEEIAAAVKQAESGGKRYAADGKTLTTSAKGALGEMQVMPKTVKDPGFGVEPARDKSPDEIARVGRDYLQAMLNKYGDMDKALVAYNMGPGSTDKWIAAGEKMEKLPEETRTYVQRVNRFLGGNVPRETKPASASKPREPLPPSLPPMAAAPAAVPMKEQVASLGPGYQAALALSFLTDTDDTDDKKDRDADREPGVAQKYLAQMDAATAARPSAFAEFADIKIRSPFAEPQRPLKMAGGGQVDLPLYDVQGNRTVINTGGGDDGYVDSNPAWTALSDKGKAEYFAANPIMADITAYGAGAIKGMIPGYNFINNATLGLGYLANIFGDKQNPDFVPVESRGTAAVNPDGSTVVVGGPIQGGQITTTDLGPLEGGALPDSAGPSQGDTPADGGGGDFSDTSNMAADGGLITRRGVVRRSEGSPEAGERALTQEEIAAALKPAFLTPKSGIGRQISTRPGELEAAALQGVSEYPYLLAGSPVDMATMVMRPFGYSVEKPFLGSEDLKERALKAGIRQKPPEGKAARALYELTQLGASAVNPAAPVRGAVKAAEATGEAAKMLARNFQQYNQQLSVPGASYAVRNKGTPFMMGYGRTEGPDGKFPAMDQAEKYIKLDVATTKDPELNDWLSSRLTSYLRRDFATPDDQFVKAADANQLLHFVNKPIPKRPDLDPYNERISDFSSIDSLPYVRKTQGFKAEGEAKTEYGKRAETLTDASAWPLQLDDITSPGLIPPGMRNMVKTDPTARLTELGVNMDEMLQFDKLAGDMERMRSMPKVYSAYSQLGIKVPEEYLLTDEMLIGLTPAQASNRVAKFRNWEEENRQRMASKALFEDPTLNRTRAEGGSVWVNPDDLAENPNMRKLVQDVGCDGGWCTREEATALSYGSGENRLSILMDSKARPQAQLTITSREYGSDAFIEAMTDSEIAAFRARYPNIAVYNENAIMSTPEFQQFKAMNPGTYSITEIKGVNNESYLIDAPYLKQIQQQVKNLDSQLKVDEVENLDGIGMVDLRSVLLNASRPFDQNYMDRLLKANGGSHYIDRYEAASFIKKLDEIPPTQRATGGMVERQSADNRRYM